MAHYGMFFQEKGTNGFVIQNKISIFASSKLNV